VVRPFYFLESQLIQNPEIVVKGGLSGSISRDGGKTFKNLETCILISMIFFDINDSNRMYCATDGGVYRVGMVQNTMEMVSNILFLNFIT
jgi:hypothetical protein